MPYVSNALVSFQRCVRCVSNTPVLFVLCLQHSIPFQALFVLFLRNLQLLSSDVRLASQKPQSFSSGVLPVSPILQSKSGLLVVSQTLFPFEPCALCLSNTLVSLCLQNTPILFEWFSCCFSKISSQFRAMRALFVKYKSLLRAVCSLFPQHILQSFSSGYFLFFSKL